MDTSPSVCAVVLTYNRKALLNECLRAVDAQSYRCDRIIVVDNCSTDGTFDMLADTWKQRVDVHSVRRNVGAAGGFNLGLRIAYHNGADAIWVLDDDVIPAPDALEKLVAANEWLQARDFSAPFVVSAARSPRGFATNVPEIDSRHNELAYPIWPQLLQQRMMPVSCATFVSILFPRETLSRYGLPIADMYIWGEDWEYTQRVALEHSGYLVGDSQAVHVRQMEGKLDIRTENNDVRIGYHFYHIRNTIYRLRRYYSRQTVLKHLCRQAILVGELCLNSEFAKAKIVAAGIVKGLTFNPPIEPIDAPFDMSGMRTSMPPASELRRPLETFSPHSVSS